MKQKSKNPPPLQVGERSQLKVFTLGKIVNTKGYYKKYENQRVSIHCASAYELPFIFRKMKREEPTILDRKVWYEGRSATLDENIEVKFSEEGE